MTTSSDLSKEIDYLVTLCTYISQTAARIRLNNLSNTTYSPVFIKSYYNELLSMSESVEGSAVLLESLLAIEHKKSVPIQPKKTRYHYTRDELLKLRGCVSNDLSIQTKKTLNQVIERESNNESNQIGNKSWRNIRTILA